MKKYMRILTALLAVLMLGMSMPAAQAATPDDVTQPQVAQRLDLLVEQLSNKYFTTTQKAASADDADECGMVKVVGTSWLSDATDGMVPSSLYTSGTFTHYYNGTTLVRGKSCCGFANYAQWYLFAQDAKDTVTTKEIAFVKFNKTNMLKYAQPGDVIRVGNSTSGSGIHSAVVYAINDTTVTVVDSNWTIGSDKCKVTKHTINYSSYSYVGITRAKNYEYPTGWYTIDVSDDSEGLKHRDGPASSYTQLQRVPDNTKVKVIDTVGNWGQYEYNGILGWSNMDYMAFSGTYVDTVTFDANGGSGTMDPIYFDVGTGFTVPECTFTKSGSRFLGWTLTNTDIGKWRCVSADGSTFEWMTEKEAAEKGYSKHLYAEGAAYNRTARIDKAASYRMVAQWEECRAELKITAQPQSVTVAAGDTVNVKVVAEGDGLTYQWYYANKDSGTFKKSSITEATYTTTMNSDRDGRQLYCVISDKYGNSIQSETVTIGIVPEHTHTYKAAVTAPTCTEKGYTTYTCAPCGDSYVDEYVDALEHTGGTATCKEQAVCERCEEAYGELNATNHVGDTEIKNAKDPTCTETGSAGDTHCTSCGAKITDGEVIPATGHTPGDEWSKNTSSHWKTCTSGCGEIADTKAVHENADDNNTCDICGYVLFEEEAGLLGDANGDGKVLANDAMLVLQYSVGAITADKLDAAVCDVNGDGKILANDAMLILQYSVGTIQIFPAEK